jgi:hypothetical protein
MDPQSPPQSRVEQLIGSVLMLMASAVTRAIWSAPSQPARYARPTYALFPGYPIYPLLLAFLTGYWSGGWHHWARATPTSDSASSAFLTGPAEVTKGPTRSHVISVVLSFVCAVVYRRWSGRFRTVPVVLTTFMSIHMYLAHVWHELNLALSYVITCAAYNTVVAMKLGYVGA